MEKSKKTNTHLKWKKPSLPQFIWMGAGIALAVVAYLFLTGFVACWKLTALPGLVPQSCGVAAPVQSGTPVATSEPGITPTVVPSAPQIELPQPWDGASRVTIMIIGLDYRDWEAGEGAPRSDTMILLTIDPVAKTAGMLSVPRDMWVNIPGFGYSKINNAYSFGEQYKLPGGGPELARKTVENFLGVEIQYYAQVDFTTFEQMVDTIGGVCLEVTQEIRVGRTYKHSSLLKPGYQCLDGKKALGYARARDVSQGVEGGDVERAQHQQQVIMAIRDKVLDPAHFVTLVGEAPTLYNELSSGINTNLGFNDAMRLAVLVKDFPLDNIQRGVIDYTMMEDGTYNLNGQEIAVLRPYPDKIRELTDKIFGGGTMKPLASGSPEENMQAEAARVVVVNGSGIGGYAEKTADYMKSVGMNVIGFGNEGDYPDNYNYPYPYRTILILHSGKPYALQYLKSLLGFDSINQVVFDFNPDAAADIVVALGQDMASINPIP
jgi:LCP family protein required for cell wall assembly